VGKKKRGGPWERGPFLPFFGGGKENPPPPPE